MVAVGHRVLGRRHEALDAVGARVGLAEVDELEGSRRHGSHTDVEADASPLLNHLALTREIDPRDLSDAPLGVRQAARVAVDDGVVGDPVAERVVALAVLCVLAGALLGFVCALALFGPGFSRRRGARLDRARTDPPAARLVGQLLELVGGFVDRLQVSLVLHLLAGRCEIGVPALGQPAPRELDGAHVEGRVQLQQEKGLLDVEDLGHDVQA